MVKTREVLPDEEKVHDKISPEPVRSAPISVASRKRTASSSPIHGASKKSKTLRKLHNVDVETNSPVSGMHIKVCHFLNLHLILLFFRRLRKSQLMILPDARWMRPLRT